MKTARKVSSDILRQLDSNTTSHEYEKIVYKMNLASKIADAMEQKNLSKKDFAKVMGKSPSEITRWLSGKHNFTTETLFDISSVLEVELVNTKRDTVKWFKYGNKTVINLGFPVNISLGHCTQTPKLCPSF